MNKKIIVCSVAALLLLAFALQVLGRELNQSAKSIGLFYLKNFSFNGWSKESIALGNTPEMNQIVSETLGYDDVTSWSINCNGTSVYVYAAYWSGGKRSAREVSRHTPDVCWINAGWQRKSINIFQIKLSNGSITKPAQKRVFDQGGAEINVIFWHVFGDQIIDDSAREPSYMDAVNNFLIYGLKGRQEQFFIRISSATPFEKLAEVPAFQTLLVAIAKTAPCVVEARPVVNPPIID